MQIRYTTVQTMLLVILGGHFLSGCRSHEQSISSADIATTNSQNQPTFSAKCWQRHLIDPALENRAIYIKGADLDGDDHTDIVVGGLWYKNPGSLEEKWVHQPIGEPLHNMAVLSDIDRDGDIDIVGTKGIGPQANADFVWAANDGQGSFTIRDNIDKADGDFLQGIAIAQFRPGIPLEIALSWHAKDKGVQMLTVPKDPIKEQWTLRKISEYSQDEDLSVGDIDRDGDLDLYQGTQWLENPGNGTDTWSAHNIGEVTQGYADRNDLFDFNGDGYLDAVVGLEEGEDVLLFTASADPKAPWERRIIGSGVGGGFSMDAADFDRDGDVDVVLGEHRGKTENRVIIYENINQNTNWTSHEIDRSTKDEIDHHDGTQAIDIDGDGDLDIISLGWRNPKVWLYENKGSDCD